MSNKIPALLTIAEQFRAAQTPPLEYLASPYTHPDPVIRNDRHEYAAIYTAYAMEQGRAIYSPIVHGHSIARFIRPQYTEDHEFWMRHCFGMMQWASCVSILPIEGWRESKGVWMEIDKARGMGIPLQIVQSAPGLAGLDEFIEILDPEEIKTLGWKVI